MSFIQLSGAAANAPTETDEYIRTKLSAAICASGKYTHFAHIVCIRTSHIFDMRLRGIEDHALSSIYRQKGLCTDIGFICWILVEDCVLSDGNLFLRTCWNVYIVRQIALYAYQFHVNTFRNSCYILQQHDTALSLTDSFKTRPISISRVKQKPRFTLFIKERNYHLWK